MKPINKLFFLFILTINVKSYAAGGPDAYGYTWLDSNDPGGPAYSWIDISTIGTEIIGLEDDNSVPLIAMGLSFGYYWIDYSEIKIGSNGWLSFNDVGNLSLCFETMPAEGGYADNFVAPFLSDLNFSGIDNPGKAYYYHDSIDNNFIVSFIDVPYYDDSPTGYIGSNTFQIIFSANDNSITYQYEDIDQENILIYDQCNSGHSSFEIGIENNSGNIGLETHSNVLPADNHAIKFYYPDVPLVDVIDLSPKWNQNSANTATLYESNQDIDLQVSIANLGNTDTLSPVDVLVEVLDENSNIVYSELMQIAQLFSLNDTILDVPNPFNVESGRYQLKVSTDSIDDLVLSNNSLSTELNVVDTNMTPVVLGHSTGAGTDIFDRLKHATYFETPEGNWMIDSVSMRVTANTTLESQNNRLSIYANDDGDNLPGSLLATELISSAGFPFRWYETKLSQPIMAPANGFFVAWERVNDLSIGIVAQSTLPISRQTYEFFPDGTWGNSLGNQEFDLLIEVELTDDVLDTIFANGFE